MTATADWSWAPPQARPFIDVVVAAAQLDYLAEIEARLAALGRR